MLSVLTTALLATAAFPQEDKANAERATLEVLPMQHVFGTQPSLAPPPWGTMLRFSSPDSRPDFVGGNQDEPQFSGDSAMELLRSLFANEIDSGTLRIGTSQDMLVITGTPDVVARVRDRARETADLLVRPLQVEVALWDAPTAAPSGVLDPRDVAQVTANRTLLWRGVGEARSGRPLALDHQRWTRYVRDAAVEVAQKQTAAQPMTDAYGQGGRIVVQPFALVGGDDLVVFVQFGIGNRRGAMRMHATGVPGVPDLEIPTLETAYGVCSARIRNGGALAITLRGDPSSGGQHLLTVRVTGRTPPATQGNSRFAVYPVGALVSLAATQVPRPPSPYPIVGDEIDTSVDIEEGPGWMEPDCLVDLVRQSLGAEGDEVSFHLAGGHLFVRGDERHMPQVETLLRGLQDRLVRTATVRHAVHLLDEGNGGPGDRPFTEIVFPTLVGRTATISRVVETNTVRDLFVEIAQEASLLDPVVDTVQSGDWVRARVGATGPQFHLAMFAQCTNAPSPTPRGVMPNGGTLGLVDLGSTRINHGGTVPNGQAIDHGDGPTVVIDGRTMRTSVTTTVSW